ncbi:hypothetical protein J6590_043436 [Homalodisca vitripennis]|nr:hypothetical protein J6590_092446 [Homalodisca vitripennis]KAG8301828.1 hypothetical protein J6590_043436 [Homalodisca vitripennis]
MRFHLLVDQYLMTKLKTLSSAYLMNECKNNIRDSLKCAVILDIKEMEPTATETATDFWGAGLGGTGGRTPWVVLWVVAAVSLAPRSHCRCSCWCQCLGSGLAVEGEYSMDGTLGCSCSISGSSILLSLLMLVSVSESSPGWAMLILQSDIKHFLSTNDFKLLDRKIIEFILKLEHLDIEEIELWWALMSWVKYNYDEDTPGTTVREKLGNMLSYVRFLAMSQKEFAEEVVKTSILTDYEMIHMFVALASGKPHGLKYLSAEGKRHPTVFVLEFKGYTTAQSSFSTFTHTILVKNRRLRLISVNLTSVLSHFYVNLEKDNSKVSTFGPFSNCASFTLDIILEANQSYNLVFETRSSGYTMCASKCEPHYSCNYCTVLVNTSSCIKNLTFIVS